MMTLKSIHTICNASIGSGIKFYSSRSQKVSLKKLYQILGVHEDCEDETLRLAFVTLAKKYHPDSGSPEACANKFSEIEAAYRQIQRSRSEERDQPIPKDKNEVEEFDIKHTAPQHRHYLQYDVGVGTPSMRQRRYTMERAQRAVENVMEHRLMKIQSAERNTLVGMDKQRAKDIKTRQGVDRLVEDLIQEAMNKGEFNNLSGTGKPLNKDPSGENPYVDFITHKLNQIMIDNGFTPEWIQLSKEIREEIDELKKTLINVRNNLGETLDIEEERIWTSTIDKLKDDEKLINKKIDKYNLLVPVLQKQRIRINLSKIAAEILSTLPDKSAANDVRKNIDRSNENVKISNNDFVDFLSSVFSKKS